jgi:hypothetical protein
MSGFDEKELLTRELRKRSEHLDAHPIGLDQVKGSARRIQWRRRAAGGAVAAAVLAVAVPLGVNLTGTTSSAPPPADQPTPTVVDTPTPTPTPGQDQTAAADGTVTIDLQHLPRGAAPAIDYLRGDTLVRADGRTEKLPAAYSSIYPFRGGWLAAERDDAGRTWVVQIDNTGAVVSREPGGSRLAVSADGLEVAYFVAGRQGGPGQVVHAIANGMGEGESSIDVPPGVAAEVVGFVAPGTVVYRTEGSAPATWVTDFSDTREVPDVLGSRAATNGLIGAQTSYNDDGTSCWEVLSGSLEKVSSTCRYTLQAFSADGKHVYGWPSDSDGFGNGALAVLEPRTVDRPVTVFGVPADGGQTVIVDAVWEDDTHLLAAVHGPDAWHLLRLGVDGSLEEAADPVSPATETSPWQFSARP